MGNPGFEKLARLGRGGFINGQIVCSLEIDAGTQFTLAYPQGLLYSTARGAMVMYRVMEILGGNMDLTEFHSLFVKADVA